MQTIQGSEAEANFSQVLEQVRQGETVLIALGDRPVARVTPEVELIAKKSARYGQHSRITKADQARLC